eukprot:15405-Eustigmatos_ZCMA.PRE.1
MLPQLPRHWRTQILIDTRYAEEVRGRARRVPMRRYRTLLQCGQELLCGGGRWRLPEYVEQKGLA